MKKIIAIVLSCALLCSCGVFNSEQPGSYVPKDEECLTIYTAHKPEVYEPIVREFEERTGIWVRVESGGTNEMLERIRRESAEPVCDLMFGGGVESLEAYGEYFTDYSPEDKEDIFEGYMFEGSKWLPFSSLPIVIIYNTKLVGEEKPNGWESLLDPGWRGKIAFADPTVSGSSYTALATMLQALPYENADIIDRFMTNLDGRILSDSGDVVGAVASGRYIVGVTLEERALKGVTEELDISMVYPVEGTSVVPDGVAVLRDCAHMKNAERFISFILGADVQKRLAPDLYRRSVRRDLMMTTEYLTVYYDIQWASSQKNEILNYWNSILGENGL